MNIPAGKYAFLICGEDDYRVEMVTHEVIDALVPESNREFGLEIIDGRVDSVSEMLRVFGDLRNAFVAEGLFGGGEKTVLLREPAFLSKEQIAKSEEIKKNIAALATSIKKGLPEGVKLVVSSLKINRAQVFFKAFGGAGGMVFDQGSGLKEKELITRAQQLVGDLAPKLGLSMKGNVIAAFVARAGTSSRQLVSELGKLASWCGDRKDVTEGDITEVVASNANSEIWDLTDAFSMRDAKNTIAILELHLSHGENEIYLVQTLISTVSTLLLLRDAQVRNWVETSGNTIDWNSVPTELAECLDLSEKDIRKSLYGWRAGKVANQAARWKVSELRAARHHLLTLREELVSTQLPERFLLEKRILQALGVRQQGA